MKDLLIRAVLTWVSFVPIAFANGAFRNAVYKPRVGDLAAHQISTVIAVVLFAGLSWLMFRSYVANATVLQLFGVGAVMVAMTMLFEFGFGHFIRGVTWSQLLRDYNLAQGRVWSLFLLTMLCSPGLVKVIEKSTR